MQSNGTNSILISEMFYLYSRQPTYKDDLIVVYDSIQNDEVMVLDINNDGLNVILDPRKSANEFLYHLEKKAMQLIREKTL